MKNGVLAWSLVRGARADDFVTMAASALGVALAVMALVFGLSVPVILSAADSAARERIPVKAVTDQGVRPGLGVLQSTEMIDGHWLERVAITGATPSAPVPPGVDRWPAPGQSIVSPALADALQEDAGLEKRLALGYVQETNIAPAGLRGPDELFAYVVVDDTPVPDGVVAFGGAGESLTRTPALTFFAEQLSLVVIPAALFALLCLLNSARRREQRYRSLVIVGMTPRQCAQLYASEMSIVAAAGAFGGLVGFAVIQGPLGTSGLAGGTWWPSYLAPRPGMAVVAVAIAVVAVVVVRQLAFASMRRILRTATPRSDAREPSPARKRLARGVRWVGIAIVVS